MKTRVQRWGNSLAVRIPKTFAVEVGLEADSPVVLRLHRGKLIVEPAVPTPPGLDELLRGVRKSNLHREVNAGPSRGNEAW